jgi:hypothetical protein
MIMQYINLCTTCITFIFVSHTCIFAIDHVELRSEEPPEPAQVKGIKTEQDQGKPRCIEPPPLSLCYPFIS